MWHFTPSESLEALEASEASEAFEASEASEASEAFEAFKKRLNLASASDHPRPSARPVASRRPR